MGERVTPPEAPGPQPKPAKALPRAVNLFRVGTARLPRQSAATEGRAVRRGSGRLGEASLPTAGLLALLLAGCASTRDDRAELRMPQSQQPVVVDGHLDESCYRAAPLLNRLVVAGAPAQAAPSTRVWAFWNPERLVFAFDVTDSDLVAQPPSSREHDVDAQDRVEIFLWSGRSSDRYYCLEVGARGAVHDYAARFYRRFDDAWSPSRWRQAVAPTPQGYQVEVEFSREALEAMGFPLAPGQRFRLGLFRADFRSGASEPAWLCWVDAHTPQPDFHVAGAFGEVILTDRQP
jgi:hypothetical protein